MGKQLLLHVQEGGGDSPAAVRRLVSFRLISLFFFFFSLRDSEATTYPTHQQLMYMGGFGQGEEAKVAEGFGL